MYEDFDKNVLAQWCQLYVRFVIGDLQRLAIVVKNQPDIRKYLAEDANQNIAPLLAKPVLEDDDYRAAYRCLHLLDIRFWNHPSKDLICDEFIEVRLPAPCYSRYILTRLEEHPIAKAIPKQERFLLDAEIGTASELKLQYQWVQVGASENIAMPCSEVFYPLKATQQSLLKIGLSPFAGKEDMDWQHDPQSVNNGKMPFWCAGAKNEDELQNRIVSVLEDARKQKLDILLFPELVLTETLQAKISDWLIEHNAFEPITRLIIAGTRHVFGDDEGCYSNRCTVFDYAGGLLWEQEKREQFCLTVEETNNIFNIQCEAVEPTQLSQDIFICRTALGRIGTPICLDFLRADDLWKQLPVDVFFVPAMSLGLSRFKKSSEGVGNKWRSAAFVCNALPNHHEHSVCTYLPTKSPVQATPHGPYLFTIEVAVDMN